MRLRSDAPVGVLLSGGIDSSSILGAIRSLGMLDNISVLSVVSDDAEANEEPFIDTMSNYTGCHVLKFKAHRDPLKLLDELPHACWFNDQPFGGFSCIAHRNLMRMARDERIKVLLTGQGSDEQLGGYNKFLYFYLQDRLKIGEYRDAARLLVDFAKKRTVIPEFRWREAKRYLPSLLKRSGSHYLGAALKEVDLLDTTLGDNYQEREWRDIRLLSLPALLHNEDRMSMSCSLEMRVPFMDYRMVELLGRTPPSRKLTAGWTKAIFRAAMEGLIPEQIQYRRDKKGFTVPEEKWMRQSLQCRFSATFQRPMLAESWGYIQRPGLQRMYNSFLGGSHLVSAGDIFRVYCFEVFLRRFETFINA
jgi:asparagine synthase (glutamine-hydrolysing)